LDHIASGPPARRPRKNMELEISGFRMAQSKDIRYGEAIYLPYTADKVHGTKACCKVFEIVPCPMKSLVENNNKSIRAMDVSRILREWKKPSLVYSRAFAE
jgi:hypothetical protein